MSLMAMAESGLSVMIASIRRFWRHARISSSSLTVQTYTGLLFLSARRRKPNLFHVYVDSDSPFCKIQYRFEGWNRHPPILPRSENVLICKLTDRLIFNNPVMIRDEDVVFRPPRRSWDLTRPVFSVRFFGQARPPL
jgi:hypothetical protein